MEPGWDRVQSSRLTDPELLEESHGMLGGRHLQVREGEPESMWTSREKSSPCFQQRSELWWVAQVQRGRDLGFVITTMVVLMTIFSKK